MTVYMASALYSGFSLVSLVLYFVTSMDSGSLVIGKILFTPLFSL
jgi:choline-glycine betaine transporter